MVAHRKVARDGSTSQTRGTLFGARPNTAPPAPTTPAPTASAPPASASKASTRRTKPDWNHDCGLTEYGKTQTLIPKFDHWEWRLGGPTQSRTVTMSTLKPTSDPEAHRALRDYPFCPSRSSDFMTHAQRSVTGQAPLLRIAKDTTGANGARHANANRVHRARWKDQDRLAPIPKWPPEHSHGRSDIAIDFGTGCTPHEKRNDADYALRSVHLKLDGNQCSAHLMYMRNLMHDKRSALA